jgi:hypothetical protein
MTRRGSGFVGFSSQPIGSGQVVEAARNPADVAGRSHAGERLVDGITRARSKKRRGSGDLLPARGALFQDDERGAGGDVRDSRRHPRK